MAVAVVGLVVAGGVQSASAHHNTITGVAVCNTVTGSWDVSWRVVNSEPLVETVTASSLPGLVAVGSTLDKSASVTFTETLASSAPRTLTLSTKWSNGQVATNSGSLAFGSKSCERRVPEAPAPFGESYSTTTGDCSTLQHVTVSGSREHTFVFNRATWAYDEVVTDVRNADVITPFTDEELATCAGPQPEYRVTYTEWVLGTSGCGDASRTDTREKSVVSSHRVGAVWLDDAPVVTRESRVVAIDVVPCPVVVPPVEPPVNTVPPAVPAKPVAAAGLVTTGADPAPYLLWSAGFVGLGAVLLVAGALVRRRSEG